MVPFRAVRATRGKAVRAEPVAALYEQGRDPASAASSASSRTQMAAMTVGGFAGRGSPDRVDALVWAITELMIEPARGYRSPTRQAASEPVPAGRRYRCNSGASVHGLADFSACPAAGDGPPEAKASAAAPVVAFQGAGRVAWSARDTSTLTRVGFLGNPVAFRCVKIIAEAAAAVPVVVQDADRRFDVHPVIDLLAAPNPGQGGSALMECFYGQPAALRRRLSGGGGRGRARGGRASSTCCGRTG